jgi:hypothetical protein
MQLQERNITTVTIGSDGFRGIPDKQFEAVKLKKNIIVQSQNIDYGWIKRACDVGDTTNKAALTFACCLRATLAYGN